ncbi:MAG: succinyl-diaminopimelate desuccinylase [Alphaproteobacteria bacterium]|jgi:succinyl-diaminopimelate desuccinylase|nr:succinyl-diaminopimelate desuccinylase [Alphaproteobacteria bacterium]MDP6660559.1 succinyl-diaminopimelate desuccinylase [Alphaproteobacteria bacterium]MDP7045060.1 succinyl-diaminopimelate desuccinylase [Alphaproteobacteria bacterium]
MRTDPLDLARALIRCPSVTPEDGGALAVLEEALKKLGFTCHRMTFSAPDTPDVDNVYARIGDTAPNFCFAGHTDVVPVGDAQGWNTDPFAGEIVKDRLVGRGAADMKGAIACFVAASARFLNQRDKVFPGSISLLITGDEEGPAVNGTAKVLDWMKDCGETLDACLVGEPTNPEYLGETIKIGRRGSLNCHLTVMGTQGHAAHPQCADNPIPRLLHMLSKITERPLDEGTEHFQPSNLEITSVDVGNQAPNIIPARAVARFNIRFNDTHSGAALEQWLRKSFDSINGDYQLDIEISGEAFFTPPGDLSKLVENAVSDVTGKTPELNTSGGISDARFIRHFCPVAEFGLVGATMHKTDESVAIEDLEALTEIYFHVLDGYFPAS